MNTLITTVPGVNADVYTLTHRHLFTNTALCRAVSPLGVIDGTKTRDPGNTGDVAQIRAGKVMGRVTSGGKYAPSIIGLTNAAVSAGTVTTITVTAAVATELQRLITAGVTAFKVIGPPSAAGTVATTAVTGVSATSTTFTISSATLPAYVTKSIIALADGSEAPLTFIPDGYGIPVTNATGTSTDQVLSPFYVGGDVDVAQIVDYPLDASLKTWLKTQLRTSAGFTFSDDR